ncbi:Zinc finger MYND domain-containing protein 10-like [Oopsacas minuta]|uniref:Zinc finger MYND domain-containing protein 10-like n=1 Tax=Oopsacas minuta TaxID=111878 RepID=A0AAV7JTQ7_9METZ|nr:Zinc finger MYND domain-containing protein 10-like [Oopsacas minuta]
MATSSIDNTTNPANKLLENVLFPNEAEVMVESLKMTSLEEIGTRPWFQQHEHIEKLNIQAIVNTKLETDEFVKEYLITHDKIPLLVHELLLVEIWKDKIFPIYLQEDFEPKVSFPCYLILYHEATLINLLETILFYKETCEVLAEVALDLIEYCNRKIVSLLADIQKYHEEFKAVYDNLQQADALKQALEKEDLMLELSGQDRNMKFQIITHCVTILRHLVYNLDSLPLGASRMILNTIDLPLQMVEMIEKQPWTRKEKEKVLKYWDGKWHIVPSEDRIKLTKTETQLWLIILQLLLAPECQSRYEYNDFKKNSILRLRSHIPEYLIDQLPSLVDLQRYLHNLSIMNPPPAKKDIIIEADHNLREALLSQNNGKFKKIGEKQKKAIFFPSKEDLKYQADKFVETYDLNVIQTLSEGKPTCANCGAEAEHRCSRCKNEWYCSRQCQVDSWKGHKEICSLLADRPKE